MLKELCDQLEEPRRLIGAFVRLKIASTLADQVASSASSAPGGAGGDGTGGGVIVDGYVFAFCPNSNTLVLYDEAIPGIGASNNSALSSTDSLDTLESSTSATTPTPTPINTSSMLRSSSSSSSISSLSAFPLQSSSSSLGGKSKKAISSSISASASSASSASISAAISTSTNSFRIININTIRELLLFKPIMTTETSAAAAVSPSPSSPSTPSSSSSNKGNATAAIVSRSSSNLTLLNHVASLPFSDPSTPLPQIPIQRFQQRLDECVQERNAKLGFNVTYRAQIIFDALSKTLPCRWEKDTIVVMEDIRIASPYIPESCSGKSGVSLKRVKFVLEGELKKLKK